VRWGLLVVFPCARSAGSPHHSARLATIRSDNRA
jgi:hypothetical protein